MCCLINSSHTQVDSQSLSFLQKEGCILPDILIHAKQFGSNIISRRRYDTEMKKQISRGRVNNLPFLGNTHLPKSLQIFKHKVLSKSWFRIQCVTNTTVTMLTICNSELGLRGPEKQATFKDRGQMHDAVLLHRAALLNAHQCELPPTEKHCIVGFSFERNFRRSTDHNTGIV